MECFIDIDCYNFRHVWKLHKIEIEEKAKLAQPQNFRSSDIDHILEHPTIAFKITLVIVYVIKKSETFTVPISIN